MRAQVLRCPQDLSLSQIGRAGHDPVSRRHQATRHQLTLDARAEADRQVDALVMSPEARQPTVLRIDASSRLSDAHSRRLGDLVERSLLAARPGSRVLHRDRALHPIAHIRADTITGYYTPPEAMSDALRLATAVSDQVNRTR